MEGRRHPLVAMKRGSPPIFSERRKPSSSVQYNNNNNQKLLLIGRRRTRDRVSELCKRLCHHLENGGGSSSEAYQSLNSKPSPLHRSYGGGRVCSRKRALLIGVTYKSWKYKLKGTINDVKNIRSLLIHHFGFSTDDILVLTELTPTKKNIKASMEWLVKGCESGDSLVFYFSGHGVRQPDMNNDEKDGFDETICPSDFMEAGLIFDNYINEAIVWPLKNGVTLHAIVDSCHSGTILDLTFLYHTHGRRWEDNQPPSGARKHTQGGLAICISACEDSQLAVDTSAFGKGMSGAMTYILVEVVKQFPNLSYWELMELIHQALVEVNNSGCFLSRFFRSIFHDKILQKPLLSASQPFDVCNKRFIL
ncbi:AMC1 [Linum perenne]